MGTGHQRREANRCDFQTTGKIARQVMLSQQVASISGLAATSRQPRAISNLRPSSEEQERVTLVYDLGFRCYAIYSMLSI